MGIFLVEMEMNTVTRSQGHSSHNPKFAIGVQSYLCSHARYPESKFNGISCPAHNGYNSYPFKCRNTNECGVESSTLQFSTCFQRIYWS